MSAGSPSFLFINVARIGDTLLATPAMRAITSAYPGCHIAALAHPKRAEVLHGLPFIAGVGGITKNTAPWRGLLGGRRYDYALVYGFDEALVAYALRVAGSVVAFRQRDQALNRRLYRCVDEPPAGAEHAVLHRLRLAAALGIPAAGRRLAYRVTPHEAAAARSRLAFDIPLVALYHCRIPSRQIAPLDHPCVYALDHPRQSGDCTESTPMSEITVDAVLAQVRRALAEHPPARPSSQAAARFA